MSKQIKLFSKAKLTLKQYSPEILMISGIIGGIASCVMACKASRKIETVTEPLKDDLECIHEGEEKGIMNGEEYSKSDAGKDLVETYVKAGFGFVKLYSPALAIGTLSIVSILASDKILRKRSIALATAYATIDRSFKEYRKRVSDRYGEETEKELYYGVEKKKITEEIEDDEGKKKKVKKEVTVVNDNQYSRYARFFDASSREWTEDPEYNKMKIRGVENWANDKLQAQGYLFLNDVYRQLDIPDSIEGQSVGWIYDPDNPDSIGDNFVSFNVYKTNRANERFVNGLEPVVLLDFNVDGPIDQIFVKYRRS